MNSAILSSLLLLISTLAVPLVAQRQPVCRGPDSISAALISELGRYASSRSGGDAAVRDSLRLPAIPADRLHLEHLESVCSKANAAYRRHLANSGGIGFSDRVYVVRIGRAFAVLDPDLHYGQPGNWSVVIMDRSFRPMAVY